MLAVIVSSDVWQTMCCLECNCCSLCPGCTTEIYLRLAILLRCSSQCTLDSDPFTLNTRTSDRTGNRTGQTSSRDQTHTHGRLASPRSVCDCTSTTRASWPRTSLLRRHSSKCGLKRRFDDVAVVCTLAAAQLDEQE